MRWQLILSLVVAAVATLPGCDQPRPVPARPALFIVRDADTLIWLFGTIHALPANVEWETPAVAGAIADADMLVTEIPPPDPAALSALFLKLARHDGLPPLADRLPADRRAALARAIAKSGMSANQYDMLETWGAAVVLGSGLAHKDGADVANGVEAVLTRRFAGRPRRALETSGSQLAFFDTLREADQRALLVRTIDGSDDYRATLSAWSRGDVSAMARANDRLFAGAPALKAALLTRRNARWSQWIANRMAQPGKVLIAVGAGHLAGRDSVVALLQARGMTVSRVQQ